MHSWGSRDSRGTPDPLSAPKPGGGGTGLTPPQEPSPLEDHLHAKFHPNLFRGLDFYREQSDKHTPTLPFMY